MQVKNLFFNVPARRKFLKSNQTEQNNLVAEFERIALVNPSVSFSLTSNGTLVTKLPAGSLRQRVVNVFGKRMNEQLLAVETQSTLVNITGFVGKPSSSRKKGANQYFFVNGRYMRHPYFHRAVVEAFSHLIPEGEQVPYFLYLDVNPAEIDVNIHPTKTEIKFENETAIWQILLAAIRDSLGRFNAVPTMDFESAEMQEIPVFNPLEITSAPKAPVVQVDANYNPFYTRKSPSASSSISDWQTLYEPAPQAPVDFPAVPATQDTFLDAVSEDTMDRSVEHFQYKGQYILTSVRSGLMLVHQQRAHVRILYDRYIHQMQQTPASTQGLLFPDMVQFSPSEAILLQESMSSLVALGFDLSPLGGGSFSVNGVPAELGGANPTQLLAELVENLKDGNSMLEHEVRHRLALTMARQTSIVMGQALSPAEMENLIADLFQSTNPNLTPDGKTIVTILSQDEIESRF